MSKIAATRYHDISVGHRVVGHEGKCRFLHGHNYRVHFDVEAKVGDLDTVGRVVDFGVIKSTICQWMEEAWDHKFLVWEQDTLLKRKLDADEPTTVAEQFFHQSFVYVPFNPTAENIAQYLLGVVGPRFFNALNLRLTKVTVEETRKCSASATLGDAL